MDQSQYRTVLKRLKVACKRLGFRCSLGEGLGVQGGCKSVLVEIEDEVASVFTNLTGRSVKIPMSDPAALEKLGIAVDKRLAPWWWAKPR